MERRLFRLLVSEHPLENILEKTHGSQACVNFSHIPLKGEEKTQHIQCPNLVPK